MAIWVATLFFLAFTIQFNESADFGEQCKNSKECNLPHSSCSNNVCVCGNGYVGVNECSSKGCQIKCYNIVIGDQCEHDVQCLLKHSICHNKLCQCKSGFRYNGYTCVSSKLNVSTTVIGIIVILFLLVTVFIVSAIKSRRLRRRAENEENRQDSTFGEPPLSFNGHVEIFRPPTYNHRNVSDPPPVYTITPQFTEPPPAYDEVLRFKSEEARAEPTSNS